MENINAILQSRLEFHKAIWNIASAEIVKAKREQSIADFGQQMVNSISSIAAVNLAMAIAESVDGCDASDKEAEFINRMKNAILEKVYNQNVNNMKNAYELTSIVYEIQESI